MSRGPENTFRASLHKHLDTDLVYQEKMHNEYRGGTPDDWYSGRAQRPRHKTRDLWIEWKFIVVPVRDATIIDLVSGKDPAISYLQQEWIKDRVADGRDVWVGVGCKDGAVLLKTPAEWQRPLAAGEFRKLIESRKQIAQRITDFVQGAK